jgi:hypothetical protein
MSDRVKKLTEEVRKLSHEEQADLFDALLVIMHRDVPEADRAFIAEIERRVEEINSGAVTLLDYDEVMSELRSSL